MKLLCPPEPPNPIRVADLNKLVKVEEFPLQLVFNIDRNGLAGLNPFEAVTRLGTCRMRWSTESQMVPTAASR